MKKQIIISNYDDVSNPFYSGGGARAIHEVAKRLTSEYKVTVLTGKYKGSQNRTIDKVRYERVGVAFGGAKVGQIVFQMMLPFYVVTKKYYVWIENFTPPFSTSFLQLFTRRKVVGLVHMLSAKDMERKYRLPFHLIENLGLLTYKSFIVTQEQTKNEIEKVVGKTRQISVIPNGVSVPSKAGKDKKHLLFLGRIEVNQKGLDLLLSSFALATKKITMPLVIAGDGEEKQVKKLKSIISRMHLEKSVFILGRVEGEKKEELLKNAYAVLVPSRFETFSMVALEAMAHSVPVVTYDIVGLSWVPDNAGIKVKPFSKSLFSAAIVSLIRKNDLRNTLGKAGKRYASKLSWEKVTEKYKKVLAN